MTQHVRNSYRDHRKATWALVLGVAAVIATVVIPFATGARPATYTFTGSTSVCAGTSSVTFSVTLMNTSKTQNLGSADLYAPRNISVAGTKLPNGAYTDVSITGAGTTAYVKFVGDVTTLDGDPRTLISLRSLQLPGGQQAAAQVRITASVKAVPPAPQKDFWYSLAKQANEFNPGDLDTSNAFTVTDDPTISGVQLYPYFEATPCTLEFVTQPPNPWEKDTTTTQQLEVAVFAGVNRVAVGGIPDLTVASGSAGDDDDFAFGSATFDTGTTSWKWPLNAKVLSSAVSGLYNLVARLGSMADTSDSNATTAGDQPFRVTDNNCLAGETCNVTSNLGGPQSQVGITNTLPGSIAIDFSAGDDAYDANGNPKCANWNRASYTDGSGVHYFPGVVLDFAWGDNMLKLVYRVRNSEWTLTNVARGNNDIEFCAGARHWEDVQRGGEGDYAKVIVNGVDTWVLAPFVTKSGGPAVWNPQDKLYWGVLTTVSNPAKVKKDPAVCARGTQDLLTGANNTYETWRTWTICIPFDWDWKNFG